MSKIEIKQLAYQLAVKSSSFLYEMDEKTYTDFKIVLKYFTEILTEINQDDTLYIHYGNIIADKTSGKLVISISIYEE